MTYNKRRSAIHLNPSFARKIYIIIESTPQNINLKFRSELELKIKNSTCFGWNDIFRIMMSEKYKSKISFRIPLLSGSKNETPHTRGMTHFVQCGHTCTNTQIILIQVFRKTQVTL